MRERPARAWASAGAVMEGRDIGSVVFPDAPVKLYLVAEPTRAGRAARGATSGSRIRQERSRRHCTPPRDERDAMTNPLVPGGATRSCWTRRTCTVEETLRAALAVVERDRRRSWFRDERARLPSGPRIVIVGRQNVGKSTLVNRLFGRRETIADDEPGVTRDRVELEAMWRGRRFALVDTAGFLRGASGVEALAGAPSRPRGRGAPT